MLNFYLLKHQYWKTKSYSQFMSLFNTYILSTHTTFTVNEIFLNHDIARKNNKYFCFKMLKNKKIVFIGPCITCCSFFRVTTTSPLPHDIFNGCWFEFRSESGYNTYLFVYIMCYTYIEILVTKKFSYFSWVLTKTLLRYNLSTLGTDDGACQSCSFTNILCILYYLSSTVSLPWSLTLYI